jgi:phage major head subunit gpT-like protein
VNIYKGTAELMVCGDIDSDTEWFLMDTTKPLKPLIFQNRKAPVPVAQTNPDSGEVFNKATYLFSVEARGNAGFSFWQLIYGSTGADA